MTVEASLSNFNTTSIAQAPMAFLSSFLNEPSTQRTLAPRSIAVRAASSAQSGVGCMRLHLTETLFKSKAIELKMTQSRGDLGSNALGRRVYAH